MKHEHQISKPETPQAAPSGAALSREPGITHNDQRHGLRQLEAGANRQFVVGNIGSDPVVISLVRISIADVEDLKRELTDSYEPFKLGFTYFASVLSVV